MKDTFALRLYRRVARLGGFSGAARECELSQSQASRIIADLESDLGTRPLSRGTRAVVPTAAFPRMTSGIPGVLPRSRRRDRGQRGRLEQIIAVPHIYWSK
jgi:DNA-binding transcriptional LysR family regulator